MKVAYVLSNFPALSETFIVREMVALKEIGFDIRVFAISEPAAGRRSRSEDSDLQLLLSDTVYLRHAKQSVVRSVLGWQHVLEFVSNPRRYIEALKLSRTARGRVAHYLNWSVHHVRLLRKEDFDHIHAHFADDGCTHAMFFSMLTGIPFSFTVHAHDIFLAGASDLLQEKLLKAKFIASISEFNKQFLLDKYREVPDERIAVVHCGIDTSDFELRKTPEGKAGKLLGIGRLVEQKGFKHLIRACKILLDSCGQTFECEIIGEGAERAELEQLIQESGLQSFVRLSGAREQDYVRKALSSADIFVLPCVVESTGTMDGIPVALMEAMALGIPVVTTTVSGIPELLRDGGGALVQPENPEQLAQAISAYLDLAPDGRAAIGLAGRAMIEAEFDLRKETNKLAALFRQRR